MDAVGTLAEVLVGRGDVRGAIVKHRGRGRVTGPVPMAVHGEAPPERLVVGEGLLRFEVKIRADANAPEQVVRFQQEFHPDE